MAIFTGVTPIVRALIYSPMYITHAYSSTTLFSEMTPHPPSPTLLDRGGGRGYMLIVYIEQLLKRNDTIHRIAFYRETL